MAQTTEKSIEAAVLNIDLNGEDVLPLVALLRANSLPFLFHTGHSTRADLAAEFVIAPVCPKPALFSELIDRITELIRPKPVYPFRIVQ